MTLIKYITKLSEPPNSISVTVVPLRLRILSEIMIIAHMQCS